MAAALAFEFPVALFQLRTAIGFPALPLHRLAALVVDPPLLLFAGDAVVAVVVAAIIAPIPAAVVATVGVAVAAFLAVLGALAFAVEVVLDPDTRATLLADLLDAPQEEVDLSP